MLNLHHLRVFHAIALEGSITRAALRLQVSQPAISRQVGELERTLATPLFDRVPRGVRLTEAGRRLAVHAQRIFASEAAALDELRGLADLERGRLAVGASTTIGSYLIPLVLGEFRRRYPGVTVELEIGNTAVIQREVLDQHFDLGLTEGFVGSTSLEVEVVAQDEMVAIAPPDHPLARLRSVPLATFLREPFVLRERGSGTRDVIEAALAQRGVSVAPALSLGSSEAIKRAVEAGLGVAIISRLAVDRELRDRRLAAVDVRGLRVRRALHLVRLRDRHRSVAERRFVEVLRASLAQGGARLRGGIDGEGI